MKSFKLAAAAVILTTAVFSCTRSNTLISGQVADAADTVVVLKSARAGICDTLKTGADGSFSHKLTLSEPEFLYLYYGGRQVASVIALEGDRIKVYTDTLGAYRVEGSEESVRLQKVENAYNSFMRDIQSSLRTLPDPDKAISRRYVEYYRDRVNYVMANSKSLSAIPVFFQKVNENLPVFDQPTDGLIMQTVADSLKSLYPKSRYMDALAKEARQRMKILDLQQKLREAGEIGYYDIELPGMEGTRVKLSESLSKVTMLYFWDSSSSTQKIFNLDQLIPIYNEFAPRGFQIYAVSLVPDKGAWASAVKTQNLPWINVCDTRGVQSPYIGMYGVSSLPMAWFIVDGEIDSADSMRTADDIRAYLRKVFSGKR